MRVGAIVLCGGQSRRMGAVKATLPFGPETMLQRVLRLLGEVVQPLVVVAAPDQCLPALAPEVLVTRDRQQGFGPLEGIRAGLTALQNRADAAYVTGCDAPLLSQSFVRFVIDQLGDCHIAVPTDGDLYHPLAAVYRTQVVEQVERLLEDGQRRPKFLFDMVPTRTIPVAQLRKVDPELRTLGNLNYPADYSAALAVAGLDVPNNFPQISQSR